MMGNNKGERLQPEEARVLKARIHDLSSLSLMQAFWGVIDCLYSKPYITADQVKVIIDDASLYHASKQAHGG